MNKSIKRSIRVLLLLIGLFLIYLVAVIGWAMSHDFDPPASSITAVDNAQIQARSLQQIDTLDLISWNIGYMGLGATVDFFYDGGETVRSPKEAVQNNRSAILQQLKSWQSEVDFFLLQEVDRESKRSYYQDEYQAIRETLPDYQATFATNYQVDFIPIPLTDPMGQVWSGVATLGRQAPSEATRYSFKGNYDWPTYLFFLDRCFLLTRFPLFEERQLVVINTHNSAYDDGTLKQQQMEQLKKVLLDEYAKGNAVIVGGDWNQFPPRFAGVEGFPLQPEEQDERFFVPIDYPAAGWQWAADYQTPTNRSLKAPYDKDTTRRYVIDYFLLSPNVSLLEVEGINLNFQHSDHQPVRIRIALP
ncbi:MAG: endonuclease/exonuclease/phosphatase family protein [Bacteroidota bacterium]